MKKLTSLILIFCILIICPLSASAVEAGTFTSEEAAAQALLEKMIDREHIVTFTLKVPAGRTNNINSYCMGLLDTLTEKALAHTGNPVGGDYLSSTYEYIHREVNYSWTFSGAYTLNFTYTTDYRTTKAQEDALTARLTPIMNRIIEQNKTDYDRVKAIHQHIIDTVEYDYTHLGDNNYILKYTAYAAEMLGASVCQGYTTLFYRMCLMAGIDCRIIFGKSIDPSTNNAVGHAWNIVKLDGKWYNVDCTWDDSRYSDLFFLKGSQNFKNHFADSRYNTAEFKTETADYTPTAAVTVTPVTETTTTPAPETTTTPAVETTTTPSQEINLCPVHGASCSPQETTTTPSQETINPTTDKTPLMALPTGYVRGDTDCDGELTSMDARFTLRAAIKLEYYPAGTQEFICGDVDGDNQLTVTDARIILRAAVGLEKL